MRYVIRVVGGRYQVGRTTDGIDFEPVGEPFEKVREAIRLATRLEAAS